MAVTAVAVCTATAGERYNNPSTDYGEMTMTIIVISRIMMIIVIIRTIIIIIIKTI